MGGGRSQLFGVTKLSGPGGCLTRQASAGCFCLRHFRAFVLHVWVPPVLFAIAVLPGSFLPLALPSLHGEELRQDSCAYSAAFQPESAGTPTTLVLAHAAELAVAQCFQDQLTFRRTFPFSFRGPRQAQNGLWLRSSKSRWRERASGAWPGAFRCLYRCTSPRLNSVRTSMAYC